MNKKIKKIFNKLQKDIKELNDWFENNTNDFSPINRFEIKWTIFSVKVKICELEDLFKV